MVDVIFTLLGVLVALPVIVLALEISVSMVAQQRMTPQLNNSLPRPAVAVIVPAHNEASGISQTLTRITAQISERDRLLVVADNCDDTTADLARDSGAIVLERTDDRRRGKGFALAHAINFLTSNPPDVIIVIDADCLVGPGLIDQIASRAAAENRPVQAKYIMKNNETASALDKRFAEFAWRIKNCIRPLGQMFLGLPCQLMGSGMAIPFEQLRSAKLENPSIVEDMQLGMDLAAAGFPPLFCPEVEVTSWFPESGRAAEVQRKRWEHGHIGMIVGQAPGFVAKSLARRDIKLLSLVLDLMVPPLALLAIIVLFHFSATALMMLAGSVKIAFPLSGLLLFLFVCSVFIAWLSDGKDIISLPELPLIPILVVRKAPLYLLFMVRRQIEWVRTERERS